MAKKKQELSPEERLAAALVPEEEQPYGLPEGWKWVYLGKIMEWTSGGTPSRKHVEYYNGDIPWVKTGELNDGYINDTSEKITEEAIKCSSAKVMPVHTVLLAMYGATIGRVAILNIKAATNQACACGICSEWIYFKFLFYFLKSQKNHFINLSKGGAQPNISQTIIKKSKMPLVEYAEQKRVVSCIESLFAKLDAAKAKVQSVLDAHEARKAALLHDAFTGKLTAKWRTEQGIDENVYRRVPLAEVCNSIFDGDHMPPPKSSSGIPFLVISNVNTGKVNFSDTRFVPQDYYDALTDTRKPQNGDVLYTLVGTYGIPVLVDTDQAFCFQRHMALLKPREDTVLQKYLWYALQERNFYREATKIAKGTAQLTVPIKGLRQLTIPMASLLEQQELVRILDRLLDREETVRQSAESVLESIDRMKQSILARSFRGEL